MFCKNCGSQVPDGIAFCAVCGTPVAGAEAAPAAAAAAPAAKGFKLDKNLLIKVVAGVAALALIVVLFAAILGGGSAKSVAKKYVKAEIEGDIKTQLSLSVGNMQKMLKKEGNSDVLDATYESIEKSGEKVDVDVNVSNLNQYYKANKKVTKAQNVEEYGKYKVKIEIRKVKDMRNSVLEEIQDACDTDMFEDYINANKIKKGKIVTVKVYIDGKEDSETYDAEVYVVKYKGKWKVADGNILMAMGMLCMDKEDYEDMSGMGSDSDYEMDYNYDYNYDDEDYDY